MFQGYAQFQDSACDLTLAQGLDEFYGLNAAKFSKPTPDLASFKMLAAHDACHVLFGVNTSPREEAYGDAWTVFGTTVMWKDYIEFSENGGAAELLEGVDIHAAIGGYFKAGLGVLKIFFRTRTMTKKWDMWAFENRLNDRLVDLRKEFGVKILVP